MAREVTHVSGETAFAPFLFGPGQEPPNWTLLQDGPLFQRFLVELAAQVTAEYVALTGTQTARVVRADDWEWVGVQQAVWEAMRVLLDQPMGMIRPTQSIAIQDLAGFAIWQVGARWYDLRVAVYAQWRTRPDRDRTSIIVPTQDILLYVERSRLGKLASALQTTAGQSSRGSE